MKRALEELDAEIDTPKFARALLKKMRAVVDKWEQPAKTGFRFGPSSLHDANEYDLVLEYWVPQPRVSLGLDMEMYGKLGQAAHDIIQEVLYSTGFLAGSDVDGQYKEIGFDCAALFSRGRVDGLVTIPGMPIGHGLCPILEIKTVSRRVYGGLRTADDISDRYKMQAEIYQKMFETTSTWFMFVCRDSMRRKIIVYDYTGSYWQAARDKMTRVIDHCKNRTIPQIKNGITNEELQLIIDESLSTRDSDTFYDLENWSVPDDKSINSSIVLDPYPFSK